ncbi:fungal-specific transcription factor domain-containing protein [Crucibulum laeve]|uniref:Fungal-specific transcription factor domain-containing protein n=1 Tax=Crucibulum laeve TaxID=68775 RepID=A0A5C3MGG6_9AGAR|nr:fungal-specific transcription factor domain-containing protein [Crucibulum laeve]
MDGAATSTSLLGESAFSPRSPGLRKKDGSLSKMRSHRGNIPVLPQNKLCPHCPAKFTRTTHLNRHLRTHTNERFHCCDICNSQFTRSDLLTRHKKSCNNPSGRTRRKACMSCVESKIKCDRQLPCSKCKARGIECTVAPPARRRPIPNPTTPLVQSAGSPSDASTSSPPTAFAPTPEANYSYSNETVLVKGQEDCTETPDLISSSPHPFPDPKTLFSQYDDPIAAANDFDVFSSLASDVGSNAGVPVINSHLSSAYSSDMFEPFFSGLFSQTTSSPPLVTDVTSWAGVDFRTDSSDIESRSSSSPVAPPPSTIEDTVALLTLSPDKSTDTDLHHYLNLFFSAFLLQIPIIHAPTFRGEKTSPVLLSAMQACGALYVRTRKAADFVTNTLASARDALIQDFARNPNDSLDQMQLILAVVLLQTIGLFHQQSDQRASSNIYHGMLVMMVRRTGLITKNASWDPGNLAETSLETSWHEWARNEMTKRAILWSYMHDCCQCIYFALPSSFQSSEMVLNLPCEDALWEAPSATEWFLNLQSSSKHGSSISRLTGISLPTTMAAMEQTSLLAAPIPLNAFARFVLIHCILRRLFLICVNGRPSTAFDPDNQDELDPDIHLLQFALHNWLQNWMQSSESSGVVDGGSEPSFIRNTLPFYWLGQVALLAYQEGLPPFECNSQNNFKVDVRFRLVKLWLKHIRAFLKSNDEAPTLFWDELMKLRLQSWQIEIDSDLEDHDGLLGFFSDT